MNTVFQILYYNLRNPRSGYEIMSYGHRLYRRYNIIARGAAHILREYAYFTYIYKYFFTLYLYLLFICSSRTRETDTRTLYIMYVSRVRCIKIVKVGKDPAQTGSLFLDAPTIRPTNCIL